MQIRSRSFALGALLIAVLGAIGAVEQQLRQWF